MTCLAPTIPVAGSRQVKRGNTRGKRGMGAPTLPILAFVAQLPCVATYVADGGALDSWTYYVREKRVPVTAYNIILTSGYQFQYKMGQPRPLHMRCTMRYESEYNGDHRIVDVTMRRETLYAGTPNA
ncbi:hypothetical protein Y032_0048g1727 [Ancylostoma ceylanicum]|uniref:Uncharacterized protein n=1 Tax=Ancylostoma ceylanicum TaxID=53326 RepID=A0A016UAG6_9BILA|nr:hypothetical protein Y032_0048g1727 [Ancylostoma ceylanicum]